MAAKFPSFRSAAVSEKENDSVSAGAALVGRIPLISVRQLRVQYPVSTYRNRRWKSVLDGIDLDLYAGECLGLMGESGSGKSTIARLLVGAAIPHRGMISHAIGKSVKRMEFCKWVQLIGQSPHTALDPFWTVFRTLCEPLAIHFRLTRAELQRTVEQLLESVQLDPTLLQRRPHELSGGQKQRIAIARALAVRPRILICDEVISALDPCVQLEILELLQSLQRRYQLSILFISHDRWATEQISQRLAVIENGKIVKISTK
jgi:ABC-type dipeptide/oligopeptide/nickel transport system ATPase subunit